MTTNEKQIVVSKLKQHPQPQMLMVLDPEQAKKVMKLYQEFTVSLLDKSDYQAIQGKQFKKKSAWRKYAMAYNISVRVYTEKREELLNGDYAYHFICEATHPNGRVTSGSGSCTAMEKGIMNSLHNVRSTAETRAWNRAVSNMIAAGEVSAEEINQESQGPRYIEATIVNGQPTENSKQTNLPVCEQCGGDAWDNRTNKKNPKAPDFKCKQQHGACMDASGQYPYGMWEKKQTPQPTNPTEMMEANPLNLKFL